ncbi:DUF4236 domain-containing protein [Hasllibacter sp. MH4015]|uniref:DUF4236 domain-containing protein n=1 Tax=Hasllibacter sp. MH4015 TaxID=2854029 RepID=UPI001CD76E27
MGFGFRKSFKIAPGVRINTGKRGASVSLGGKGLTTNISNRGTRVTASIPKTGLSYTATSSAKPKAKAASKRRSEVSHPAEVKPVKRSILGTIFMWIGIFTVGLLIVGALAG